MCKCQSSDIIIVLMQLINRKCIILQDFTITRKKNKNIRNIAALYVNENYIYFSCCEERDRHYSIRKYTIRGKHEFGVQGFKPVRGIGFGASGGKNYFYFADNCVLKFDEQLRLVHKSEEYRYPFFGLVVTNDYVLVCEERDYEIFVFDHNLQRLFTFNLTWPPTDITSLGDQFFVTTRNAILVLKIDFANRKLESEVTITEYCSSLTSEENVKFNCRRELRSICAFKDDLYVVEKESCLFRFRYSSGKLSLVAENKNCSPVVIETNGKNVYCSQERNDKCIISKVNTSSAQLSCRTVIH